MALNGPTHRPPLMQLACHQAQATTHMRASQQQTTADTTQHTYPRNLLCGSNMVQTWFRSGTGTGTTRGRPRVGTDEGTRHGFGAVHVGAAVQVHGWQVARYIGQPGAAVQDGRDDMEWCSGTGTGTGGKGSRGLGPGARVAREGNRKVQGTWVRCRCGWQAPGPHGAVRPGPAASCAQHQRPTSQHHGENKNKKQSSCMCTCDPM